MKLVWALALCCAGCSLDSFVYDRDRVDHYTLDPSGPVPEETIRAEQFDQVRISVSDGIELGAAYVRASVQPPRAYVIFFHGKGGTIEGQWWRAKRWANTGFDILVFDYRGYGTSTNVTPDEAGIGEDGLAVRRYMVERTGHPEQLIYWGQSFGSGAATQLAQAQAPATLLLESAYSSIEDIAQDSSQLDLPSEFVMQDSWRTKDRIGQVAAPVLLLHGLVDQVLPYVHSQRLFARANDPKKLVLVEGADHNNLMQTMGPDYAKTIDEFIAPFVP